MTSNSTYADRIALVPSPGITKFGHEALTAKTILYSAQQSLGGITVYSVRNARAGSMDAARRAGTMPATNAATANAAMAPVKTVESALVIS
jgi:hypothetical protein